jgi:membrane protease subunit (stomatin/prohibitin family)
MTPQVELDNLTIRSSTGSLASDFQDLTVIAEMSSEIINKTVLFRKFMECSLATGGYVHVLPQMGYMPILIGNDDQPVYLYQLIEMFEGFLDYDALLAEFPTLNFSQISGAISFLRKIAQVNSRQIDVDELEDQLDADFVGELRQAFGERGNTARVLTDAI